MNESAIIRLVVSDVEGCITPPNRGTMRVGELESLAEYCRATRENPSLPPLVLCTGRQIPYAECVVQLIGAFFPGFPSIVENGAFLYDVANNDIIPNPILQANNKVKLHEARQVSEGLIKRYGAKKEYGKDACISLNPPATMTVEDFFVIVCEELSSWSGIVEITHSKSAVDITPAGVDKASGLLLLAERTGIAPTEMLGIGDTRGDLPMLKCVGIPTGPANASEEVRQIAHFIAPSPGPAGVAEILRRYVDWK